MRYGFSPIRSLISLMLAGAAALSGVIMPANPAQILPSQARMAAPRTQGETVREAPPTPAMLQEAERRLTDAGKPRPSFNFGRRRLMNRDLIKLSMQMDAVRRHQAAQIAERLSHQGPLGYGGARGGGKSNRA